MFFSRQKKIEVLINEYIKLLKTSAASFRLGFSVFLADGFNDEFSALVAGTHEIESKMDSIKREVAYEMYSKTILPESRGDILRLIELAEKIPGFMQSVLFEIQTCDLRFPKVISGDLSRLADESSNAAEYAADCFLSVFSKKEKVFELAEKIDQIESRCDILERNIISSVFKLSVDSGNKVLLKYFVERLGAVSDSCEHLSDLSVIVSVKGQI